MKNFKEIAEKCLAGELRGIFINRRGDTIPSDILHKWDSIKYPYIYWETNCINRNGNYFYNEEKTSDYDIIDFIPDNMQKKIEIDIPKGKIPVMEQVEKGIVITWKEKELTYSEIYESLWENGKVIHYIANPEENTVQNLFINKVNALRKLINIRNYFGKPKHFCDGIVIKCVNSYCGVETGQFYFDKPDLDSLHQVIFAKKEHAEQAIKMLGDELKYLFEPW